MYISECILVHEHLLYTINIHEENNMIFPDSSLCGFSHPHIWKFLDLLKKEIIYQNCRTAQQNSGHEPQPQRKKYKDSLGK